MNKAKINLECNCCRECPYVREKTERGGKFYCVYHGMKNPGLDVGEGDYIPDWCPFVLIRLEKVAKTIHDCSGACIPKKYLTAIERKQKLGDPDPKFGADHSFGHAHRVFEYGRDFLEECIGFGILSNNQIQKLNLLLEIASELHDIGLADSARNHNIHSAELAKKFFESGKVDIDEEDAQMITHAIYNHTKGHETRNFLDAALLLGDKLDVTKDRIVSTRNNILFELTKVNKVEFELFGKLSEPRGAKLTYYTEDNFNYLALRDWDKCISVPLRLTENFLKLPEFHFFINEKEVDVSEILS